MPGLERVVAHIAKGSHADVANRQPALQRMMASAMQQVRDANRGHGCRRFQAGESCRIVDHVVREENLLSPTSLEVTSGGVVHAPGHSNSGKEQQICAIPEGMRRLGWRRICRKSVRRLSLASGECWEQKIDTQNNDRGYERFSKRVNPDLPRHPSIVDGKRLPKAALVARSREAGSPKRKRMRMVVANQLSLHARRNPNFTRRFVGRRPSAESRIPAISTLTGIRFPSPPAGYVRMNLLEFFSVFNGHSRRHLWQAANLRRDMASIRESASASPV